MVIGSFGYDLWQGLNLRREMISLAESAAIAASSGINEQVWRNSGTLALHTGEARWRARQIINRSQLQSRLTSPPRISVWSQRVTVELTANYQYGLLSFLGDGGRFPITVQAVSRPEKR